MRIEFIGSGSQDCPLVRMHRYSRAEIELLREACLDLAEGRRAEYVVSAQPWVEVGGCELLWKVGESDRSLSGMNRGLWMPKKGEPFTVRYPAEEWLEVRDKLEPMLESDGFQRLTDEGDVSLLVSVHGGW